MKFELPHDDARLSTVENDPSEEKQKIASRVKKLLEGGLYEEVEDLRTYPDLIDFSEVQSVVEERLNVLKIEDGEASFQGILKLKDVFKMPVEKVRTILIQKIESITDHDLDLDLNERTKRLNPPPAPKQVSETDEDGEDNHHYDYYDDESSRDAYREQQRMREEFPQGKYKNLKYIVAFLRHTGDDILSTKDKDYLTEKIFGALVTRTENFSRDTEKETILINQMIESSDHIKEKVHDADIQNKIRTSVAATKPTYEQALDFVNLVDDKESLKNPEVARALIDKIVNEIIVNDDFYVEKNVVEFKDKLKEIENIAGISLFEIHEYGKQKLLQVVKREDSIPGFEYKQKANALCTIFDITPEERTEVYCQFLRHADELVKAIHIIMECGGYDSSTSASLEAIKSIPEAQELLKEELKTSLSDQEDQRFRRRRTRRDSDENLVDLLWLPDLRINLAKALDWDEETLSLMTEKIEELIKKEDFVSIEKFRNEINSSAFDYEKFVTPSLLRFLKEQIKEGGFSGSGKRLVLGLKEKGIWNKEVEEIVWNEIKNFFDKRIDNLKYITNTLYDVEPMLNLFPKDEVNTWGLELYKTLLSRNPNYQGLPVVRKLFNVTDYDLKDFDSVGGVEEIKKKDYISFLEDGQFKKAAELKEISEFKQDFLNSFEVYQAVDEGILASFKKGFNVGEIITIIKYFPERISMSMLLKDFPKLAEFAAEAERQSPELVQKYFTDVPTFLRFYSSIAESGMSLSMLFEITKENPFLTKALAHNENLGLKLLIKFGSLDNLSKMNIQELYDNKDKIISESPNIEQDSRDFRIAMQTCLEGYRRNKKILEALRESGVDVEEWLNHEDELYFELGREIPLTFSEALTTPIDRMQEGVGMYISTIKELIEEYKKELLEFMVPFKDIEELKKELEEMMLEEEKAKAGGNIKKAQGISKGISNLQLQIDNPKTISLWNKFLNNLSLIDLARADVSKAYSSLKEAETELQEKENNSTLPRAQKTKELLKIKSKIDKYKKEIEEKRELLDKRLMNDTDDIFKFLKIAFGEDRAGSILQERAELIGEFNDHYGTDKNTINDIFKKNKQEGLEGRPMKVGLWNRNPDIDLYLGNYTDCCIRIDSQHMGEESTIADYLTDNGMQVVTILDEKADVPVAAAWCWIGHDDEDSIALVIDNIEANTNYSTAYKKQLENKLKFYIDNYAKKVGLKVVQGSKNNDLTIASMDSDYFKVGGYNRASGYFLEGEGQ